MILLNWFNYFESNAHYSPLHLYMERGEEIFDKPRTHAKYTGVVYPYITDSFGSFNPGCPQHGGLNQTWVSVIIIYLLRGVISMYTFRS